MESKPSNARRMPFFFMMIAAVLVVLALVTVIQVLKMYRETGYIDVLALTLSASAIGFSVYVALQMRSKPLKLGFEQPKVSTVIRCSNCGFETTRDFREGDYVLKEAESCPKCKGSMFIYTIFRESEETKKKRG